MFSPAMDNNNDTPVGYMKRVTLANMDHRTNHIMSPFTQPDINKITMVKTKAKSNSFINSPLPNVEKYIKT